MFALSDGVVVQNLCNSAASSASHLLFLNRTAVHTRINEKVQKIIFPPFEMSSIFSEIK